MSTGVPDRPDGWILCPVCESNIDALRGVDLETLVQAALLRNGIVDQVSMARCYVRPNASGLELTSALWQALDGAAWRLRGSNDDEIHYFFRRGMVYANAMHTLVHGTPVWEYPFSVRAIDDLYRANKHLRRPYFGTLPEGEAEEFARLDAAGVVAKCRAWLKTALSDTEAQTSASLWSQQRREDSRASRDASP